MIWVPMICYEDWRCLGQCLKFNLSANVERCFTAHFALRSFEGAPHLPDRFMDRLKKSVSKMTTTSFLRDLIG